MPYDRTVIEWLEDPVAEQEAMASVELSRQTIRRFHTMVTEDVAANVATAAYLNPGASPELIVGSTVAAGAPAEDDLIAEAAALEQTQTGRVGGIGGVFADIGDGLRGVTRWTALAMHGLYDEVINRPLRTMANMVQGMDVGQAYSESGNAPFAGFGEAASQLLKGEPVNLGTGWLPSSNLARPVQETLAQLDEDAKVFEVGDQRAIEEVVGRYSDQYGYVHPDFISPTQQQMVFQSQLRDKIMAQASDVTTPLGKAQSQFGMPVTQRQAAEADSVLWNPGTATKPQYSQVSIGRVYAGLITEPGTKPFHYASGTGDFLANIFMDPTAGVSKGITAASAAHRALRGGEAIAEVVEGLGAAQRNVDDVLSEMARLEATPEYARYQGWQSAASRKKADELAVAGLVDETVSPKLARYQSAGRVAAERERLVKELNDIADNPDVQKLEYWQQRRAAAQTTEIGVPTETGYQISLETQKIPQIQNWTLEGAKPRTRERVLSMAEEMKEKGPAYWEEHGPLTLFTGSHLGNRFRLVDGQHRAAAAIEAGLENVPVRIVGGYNRGQVKLASEQGIDETLEFLGLERGTPPVAAPGITRDLGRIEEMGTLTDAQLNKLMRTNPRLARMYQQAQRGGRLQARADEVSGRILELADDAEYKRFLGWSSATRARALELGRQADIDPRVSPKLAEQQRVGRVAAQVAGELDARSGDLSKLTDMSTFNHQVRQAAGIVDGVRKDVDPKKISQFIAGPTARRFVEALRDADLAGVDRLLRHVKGTIPRSLRAELADAKTNADVISALLPHLGAVLTDTGMGLTRGLGRVLASPLTRIHHAVDGRVTQKIAASGNSYASKPMYSGSRLHRWFSEMSPGSLDLNNMDQAYQLLERHALNLGWGRGDAVLEGHLRAFADLADGDWTGAFDVLSKYNTDLMNRLSAQGLDPKIAEAVTRFTTNQKDDALWFVNRLGHEMEGPHRKTRMTLDGMEVAAPGPQLITELFKGVVHMPDPRLVRHAAAELDLAGRLANRFATRGASHMFDQRALVRLTNQAMTKAWKPMVLLRIAWPVRVVGEEQARMAAAGVSRPFTHPIHHISMALADRKMTDVLGDSFTHADEFARARAGRVQFQGEWRSRGTEKWVTWDRAKNYNAWLDGTLRELNQLWSDPVTRHLFDPELTRNLSDADRIRATARWLSEGEGRPLLDQLIAHADEDTAKALGSLDAVEQYVESVYARAHLKAGGDFQLLRPDGKWVDSRGVTDNIVDGNVPQRATYVITRPGLDEILESYGTGRFAGQNVAERMAATKDALARNPELTDARTVREALGQLASTKRGNALPSVVKGIAEPDAEMISGLDRAVSTLFDVLMSKPTNRLSRSPAFRTYYWQSIGEMAPFMDEATQAAAREAARKAGTELEFLKGAGIKKPIVGQGKLAPGDGLLTDLSQADGAAKAKALTQVQDLLFDVSKRKNASDAASIIMPFADAWGEVLGTWARITGEKNVLPFRRFQQVIESGRESDILDETSGWSNNGFFRNDGEREVFTMPILGDLYRSLSGVDADWEYPLSGLSIATSIAPAVGPVVQWVAQPIIPDEPGWQWLRDYIDPVSQTSIQRGAIPSSWARVIGAFEWSRNIFADDALIDTYNGTVGDVLTQMARDDPDFHQKVRNDRDAVLEEARQTASHLWLVQGLARYVGPAAPSTRPIVEDKDGFIWQTTALHDEYYKLVQLHQGDRIAANEEFISKFGVDPITVTNPKSTQISPRGTTAISSNFKKANPELFEDYPDIAYYLGPAYLDDHAPFDWNAYYSNIVEKTTERLDPETQLALLNDTKANLIYDKRRRDIEEIHGRALNDAGWDQDLKAQISIQLRELDAALIREYPGYAGQQFGAEVKGMPARASTEEQIGQLERLFVQRPDLLELDSEGQPVNAAAYAAFAYMQARNHANQIAQSQGWTTTMETGEADPSHPSYQRRALLRTYAAELIRAYPEFGPMWESIFGREMINDDEQEMTAEDAWEVLVGTEE